MIFCSSDGARILASSTVVMDGIFGTKISPPLACSRLERTKFTPCSSVIQKRVMRASVMGRESAPSAISLRKKGTTEPRLPMTLP